MMITSPNDTARPAEPSAPRCLVIVRAGPNSLHPGWINATHRPSFDLLVAAYHADAPRIKGPAIRTISLPGAKISGYARLLHQHPHLIDQYDYIALFDDDISASQSDIERLFEIGHAHDLHLFQPALSADSYFSYAATLRGSGSYLLRDTNFVEMMCPVFSAPALRRILPLLGMGYETGIDLIWGRALPPEIARQAIVDAVTVRHTRPIGSTKTDNGFAKHETYDRQIRDVLARFATRFDGPASPGGVTKNGRHIKSRLMLLLDALTRLRYLGVTPMKKTHFLRFALAAVRHAWRSPPQARPLVDTHETTTPTQTTVPT